MMRWILGIFCFFSLLISGGLLGLNFWSMWFYDGLNYTSMTVTPPANYFSRGVFIESMDRSIRISEGTVGQPLWKPPGSGPLPAQRTSKFKFVDSFWDKSAYWARNSGMFHFSVIHHPNRLRAPTIGDNWDVVCPTWAPTIIAGIPALLWIFYNRRYLRMRWRNFLGLCVVCGYDLRATPDRCPECGTIPILAATGKAAPK